MAPERETAVAALLSEPRWVLAAQALVDGCVDLPSDEDRVALLAAVCEGLGDELYREKLLADVDDPISGALTRQTRHALRALATAWLAGDASYDASARFLSELPAAGTRSLSAGLAQPAVIAG